MQLFTASEKAFRDFIKEHQPRVYNTALNILQNAEDAEEITQDVFVKVYKSLSGFQHKSNFKTWIYRITYHESINRLRSKKNKFFLKKFLWYLE